MEFCSLSRQYHSQTQIFFILNLLFDLFSQYSQFILINSQGLGFDTRRIKILFPWQGSLQRLKGTHQMSLIVCCLATVSEPFPKCFWPLMCQNKSSCRTTHMEMFSTYTFIFMQIKLIFAPRFRCDSEKACHRQLCS